MVVVGTLAATRNRVMVEDGAAAMADQDLMGDFEDLQMRADGAELSDEDMQEAMREECPDVFDDLEGMFQAPGGE